MEIPNVLCEDEEARTVIVEETLPFNEFNGYVEVDGKQFNVHVFPTDRKGYVYACEVRDSGLVATIFSW